MILRRDVLAGALALSFARPGWAETARALSEQIVMSGHSLTDPIQRPLEDLVHAAGGGYGTISLSTIPGSPLEWRWNNAPWLDLRAEMGRFDVLVLTERVALSDTMPFHASEEFALRFAELAWRDGRAGQGADVFLYATWVSLNEGRAWRTRLDEEREGWNAILAHLNANRPEGASPVRMIPAIAVMAALHDEIALGRAPIDGIEALFSDDIHLNDLGAWIVALAHFAVIFGQNPAGLVRPEGVSGAVQRWYEDLVWRVVNTDPGSGL